MSSMRNAVQRRNHKERAQPLERQKWGLLEKKKVRFNLPPSIPLFLDRFYTKKLYCTMDSKRRKIPSLTYTSKGLHPQSQRPQ
jgi:hypothetical protein